LKKTLKFDDLYSADFSHFTQRHSDWLEKIVETHWPGGGGRCLDLGCGHGRNALYLAKQNFEVTAVDSSQAATDYLQKKAHTESLPISVVCDDMQNVNVEAESFDLILMITSMGNISKNHLRQFTGKLVDGLRAGGLVAVEEFSPNDPGANGKHRASEFSHLVNNYFSPGDMGELFKNIKQLWCTEIDVSDHTHGHPHQHSLLRYVGQKKVGMTKIGDHT